MVKCFVRRYFRNTEKITRKSGDASMQEKKGMFEAKDVYHEHRQKGKQPICEVRKSFCSFSGSTETTLRIYLKDGKGYTLRKIQNKSRRKDMFKLRSTINNY